MTCTFLASETMEKLSELHTFQKPGNYARTSLSRLEFPGYSCELGMKGLLNKNNAQRSNS